MSRRLYPRVAFAKTNTLVDQLAHVFSEVDEAAIEADMVDAHNADLEALLPLFRELGDLQASIGTLFDVLDRITGVDFSERMILSWIEEKNRARGYYVEPLIDEDKERAAALVMRGLGVADDGDFFSLFKSRCLDIALDGQDIFLVKSQRGKDWTSFAGEVARHIENYTVPQYGDKGADQATSYTAEDHVKQAQKYLNRFGRNARPGQQRLDFLKAAHYCQMAADACEEVPSEK